MVLSNIVMRPQSAPVGSPFEVAKSGIAWNARCNIACESKRMTRFFSFSVVFFVAIEDLAGMFITITEGNPNRISRYRSFYLLRPLDTDEISWVLDELLPPEHLQMMHALETIRIDVHKPLEFLPTQLIDLHDNEGRTRHMFFDAEGSRHTFDECRFPRAQVSRERDDARSARNRFQGIHEDTRLFFHMLVPMDRPHEAHSTVGYNIYTWPPSSMTANRTSA